MGEKSNYLKKKKGKINKRKSPRIPQTIGSKTIGKPWFTLSLMSP
jgi:hypothetical protein